MNKSNLLTGLAVLLSMAAIPAAAQVQASGDAYLENPSYNISGSGNVIYGNSDSVGNNFQVTGSIPSGDTLYVTALGYYAGTNSAEFTGGGTVTANQTLALFGPSATDKGNLSGDQLAEVTVTAGTAVDTNGFAWVTLSTPVALVAGDYYDLLTTEGGSEAYLEPFDGSSDAAMVLTSGSPFSIYEGAYASSINASEGYAYSDSTYLGPNMQYQIQGPASLVSAQTNYVNPNSIIVTNFQGWGTSLAWWANLVGGYSNRDQYANLAFTQLKLNIIRYNIGCTENPDIPNTIQYRAQIPGYEPSNGVWNWNVDTNQVWMLQEALALGANHVEASSYSPPYWMTVSGSVTGSTNGTSSNLKTSYENAFAFYLAMVISNLTVSDGITFDFVTPMNEPNSDWWVYGGAQPGCAIGAAQQSRVVVDLSSNLAAMNLPVGIDASEDYDPSVALSSLDGYSTTGLKDVSLITTHTYSPSGLSSLASQAKSWQKPVWVAEYGDNDATGLKMARRIHDDITGMGPLAWIYWQFCDETGSGWGCVENDLNGDGVETYTVQEKFYVMGQFSEFVRPGCNIISVSDTNTLAAWNPTNGTLVLVMVNNTSSSLNVTYNLSDFPSEPWQVSATQTDPSENMVTLLPAPVVTNQAFTAAIPGSSVTTFVLTTNVTAPTIVAHYPATYTNTATLYAGEIPAFSVLAQGGVPLYYQWFSNGVVIAGATGANYTPPGMPSSGTVSFDCIVSNAAGSVTSLWSYAVVSEPFESYPQAALALKPVGYWPLNETPNLGYGNQGVVCHDYIAGNDGVYSNVTLAQAGYNPATEPAEVSTLFGSYASPNSDAGQIQNLDFSAPNGSNGEFSVTAWVNGYNYAQAVNAGIVTKGYFYQEELDLDEGASGADLRFEVRNATGTAYNANSTINVQTNNGWFFLAGVCDEANGNVLLYVNGVLAGQTAIPALSGITNSSSVPISIGARATSATSGNNQQFEGKIADVAIYNYALSASQVQQLWAAASMPLMNLTSSNNNLVINFTGQLLSSTNVAGPYTPVSGTSWPSYTIALTNSQMFYRVNNQ